MWQVQARGFQASALERAMALPLMRGEATEGAGVSQHCSRVATGMGQVKGTGRKFITQARAHGSSCLNPDCAVREGRAGSTGWPRWGGTERGGPAAAGVCVQQNGTAASRREAPGTWAWEEMREAGAAGGLGG